MANVYAGAHWIVDTVGKVAHDASCRRVSFSGCVFQGYGTATDTAVLKDGAGNTIITLTGNSALTPVGYQRGYDPRGVDGLQVTTLDSGKVVFDMI